MHRAKPLLVVTAAALIPFAGCGGDDGTGIGGPEERPETVEEVLDRLNIDRAETPRLGPDGDPLPENHAPLGSTRDLQRYAEIAVLGVESSALAGTDPFYVLKQVPAGGDTYDTEVLHRATAVDLPWASVSGSAPAEHRDATRGDLDGDGFEELILVYKVPAEAYVQLIVVDDESGAFARSEPIAVADAAVVGLAIEAADFDGDGLDDAAIGLVLEDSVRVVFFASDGTGLSGTGAAVELEPTLDGAALDLRLASANLDYDNGHELGIVLNEKISGEATAGYTLVDDLESELAVLDSGLVAATVGVDSHTAKVADISFGNIDGDPLPEVVFGGLTNVSFGTADKTWGYLVHALDDSGHELAPLSGTYFDQSFDELSASGQALWMDTFFVNTLDVDGDGVDEVQANQYIFDDQVAAEPWTVLHTIDEGALIYESGDGNVDFRRNTAAMAVSDVTSDGRDDVIFYSQNQGNIRVWSDHMVNGWAELASFEAPTEYNDPMWPVIVPVNVDDDSTSVRFNAGTHRLVFTEPIVIAALAAAPCNPDWGQDVGACTTAFGYAESDSVSQEDSYTLTAGVSVGFGMDYSVLGVEVGGFEILASVNTAATKTTGSTYSLTKRVVHTTGPIEDSVLFTTIPMDQYTYTITSHPNPALIGGEMVLSIPREPIQAMVTRDFYNASVLEESVKVGDDVFTHVAGDPSSYPTRSDKDAILSESVGLQSVEVDVGEGGGNTGVELSVYEEVSEGESYSIDYSLDISATAFGVIAGASVGYGSGHTISYASGSESTYAGNVANLDADHFASDQYKFGLFSYVHEDDGREFEVLNYWVHPQP